MRYTQRALNNMVNDNRNRAPSFIKALLKTLPLLLCIPSSWLWADESRDNHEDLLDAYMPTACIFTGKFSQTKETENFALSSKGTLFYHCEYGLIWQSEAPFLETTVYTLNEQYFLVSEDGDIEELTSQAQKGIADFLLRLMSGDKSYFLDSFSIKSAEGDLILTPNSRFMRKAVASILLGTNSQASSAENVQIITAISMTNGESTAVTIDTLKSYPANNAKEPLSECYDSFFNNGQDVICKLLKRKKNNVYKR